MLVVMWNLWSKCNPVVRLAFHLLILREAAQMKKRRQNVPNCHKSMTKACTMSHTSFPPPLNQLIGSPTSGKLSGSAVLCGLTAGLGDMFPEAATQFWNDPSWMLIDSMVTELRFL